MCSLRSLQNARRSNSPMNFNGLGLSYTPPPTTLKRADYHNFGTAHKFALVNTANPSFPRRSG